MSIVHEVDLAVLHLYHSDDAGKEITGTKRPVLIDTQRNILALKVTLRQPLHSDSCVASLSAAQ